jgi:hypothetical protein
MRRHFDFLSVREELGADCLGWTRAWRASVRGAMNQAYATLDPKPARRLLENVARRLESGASQRGGLLARGAGGTLTVMRLDLPENLARALSSTRLPAIVRCPNSSSRCAHMTPQSIVNVELKTKKKAA